MRFTHYQCSLQHIIFLPLSGSDVSVRVTAQQSELRTPILLKALVEAPQEETCLEPLFGVTSKLPSKQAAGNVYSYRAASVGYWRNHLVRCNLCPMWAPGVTHQQMNLQRPLKSPARKFQPALGKSPRGTLLALCHLLPKQDQLRVRIVHLCESQL